MTPAADRPAPAPRALRCGGDPEDIVERPPQRGRRRLRKRRRLYEVAGCRAETTEVEFPDGSRGMTAAVEDEVAANAQAAARAMRLGDLPNLSYPQVLEPLARRDLGPADQAASRRCGTASSRSLTSRRYSRPARDRVASGPGSPAGAR